MSPLIGQSLTRREDPEFLTGQAVYVADLEEDRLGGACHAVFVRSTFAHARVLSVGTEEAEMSPGVVAVVTAVDVSGVNVIPFTPGYHDGFGQPLLADATVRYVGEPVAVVLADSLSAGVDAAELVVVEYDPLPPVLDLNESRAGSVLLFEEVGTNVVVELSADDFPVEHDPVRFGASEVLVGERVMNPRQSAAAIETRGVAASWEGGHVHLWASTQRPHGYRDKVCQLYGIEREHVHVIAGPNVGGGFGGKGGVTIEEQIMPLLARIARGPVRWIESRTENLTASPQGRGEQLDVLLAGTRDGRIEALRIDLLKDCGAYPTVGGLLPAGYSFPVAIGPYNIDYLEFSSTSVVTNAPSIGAFRGAGRAPLIDALECVIDKYAALIGIDPAEVRRINLVRPEEMPFLTPMGSTYDEADYPGDLATALDLCEYDSLRAEQERIRASTSNVQMGIGVATYNHISNGGGGEEASVTILENGSAVVVTGSTSQGHGHVNTWAQIASDVLGISVDRIDVLEGDSDAIATGVGAVGSRSLQTAGVAVHMAAEAVVDRARQLAADRLEAAVADVVLDRGRGAFHVTGTPAVSASWAELASFGLGVERELSCGEEFGGNNTYPSGCHVAVVEVDLDTGVVKVVRFIGVDDAGTRVNPMIVEGQLHGGIASGIGQVLGEVMQFDPEGNPTTSNFMDYPVASIDLFPRFELQPTSVRSSFNIHGFKGVGESGTVGATPAVHCAVIDALRPYGVDFLDIPCTPNRVWDALRQAAKRPSSERGQTFGAGS